MGFSTATRFALRATSLGALALTILAASANSSFAQVNTTSLAALAGGPLTFNISEPPPPGAPEMMTVNISDGAFFLAPGTGLEFDMTDLDALGQQVVSDRILFDNSGPAGPLGGATALITFLSDDENGTLPPLNTVVVYQLQKLVPEPSSISTTLPILNFFGGGTLTLTALMVSDGDPTNTSQFSDSLTLSVPEPGTVVLAGLGLAALAGLAYRGRRK